MFGAEYAFADVVTDVISMVTTTGIGPLILVGLISGIATLVLRAVKRSAK